MIKTGSMKYIIVITFTALFFLMISSCAENQIKDKDITKNNSKEISKDNSKTDKKADNKNTNSNLNKTSDSTSNDKTDKNSDSDVPEKYKMLIGKYKLSITGYSGELILNFKGQKFTGTIFFKGWGKGVPQPLKNLNIKGNKIYFIRSISSKKEQKIYGGNRFFTQKFVGSYSKDGKVIRGHYVISGSIANWKAYR